jgi:predicted metal-dependent HD superfamily phosphohydrolase
MNYIRVITQVEKYVKTYMLQHKNPTLYYHNFAHTERVVQAAKQIIAHYQLSDKNIFITIAACWFHDLGQYETLVNHELAGSLKAEAFLKNKDLDEETIKAVKNCILATRLPQMPQNLLEQIICDADLFHIGTTNFAKQSKLILRELEAVHNVQIDETEWWNTTITFLENHQYYTDYCKKVLNNTKRYNLEKLKEKLRESGKTVISQISRKMVLEGSTD